MCPSVNRDMLNLTRARRTALGICYVHVLDGGTVLRTFRALTQRAATRKATRYITHLKIEDRTLSRDWLEYYRVDY